MLLLQLHTGYDNISLFGLLSYKSMNVSLCFMKVTSFPIMTASTLILTTQQQICGM
jgi:hypothetical protein